MIDKQMLEQLDQKYIKEKNNIEKEENKRRSVLEKFNAKKEKKNPGPKKRLQETKLQTFNIEQHLLDEMDKYYLKTGVSRSEFVRRAIKEKLENEKTF